MVMADKGVKEAAEKEREGRVALKRRIEEMMKRA